MSYNGQHAGALALVTRKGASVTFTRRSPGTHTATTGRFASASSSSIAGSAVQVASEPEQLRALSLVETDAPTLFFVPSTYGQMPDELDEVTWNSLTYRVRAIQRIAPDGTAIAARVVVSR
jgi:hypothetical protein